MKSIYMNCFWMFTVCLLQKRYSRKFSWDKFTVLISELFVYKALPQVVFEVWPPVPPKRWSFVLISSLSHLVFDVLIWKAKCTCLTNVSKCPAHSGLTSDWRFTSRFKLSFSFFTFAKFAFKVNSSSSVDSWIFQKIIDLNMTIPLNYKCSLDYKWYYSQRYNGQ